MLTAQGLSMYRQCSEEFVRTLDRHEPSKQLARVCLSEGPRGRPGVLMWGWELTACGAVVQGVELHRGGCGRGKLTQCSQRGGPGAGRPQVPGH